MELAKGGELFDKLLEQGCLAEKEAGRLMTQVYYYYHLYLRNTDQK